MTRLLESMRELGVQGEVELDGRWVRIRGERCSLYVAETDRGEYLTWCEGPCDREVRRYTDPHEAIRAGLERAGGAAEGHSRDWIGPRTGRPASR